VHRSRVAGEFCSVSPALTVAPPITHLPYDKRLIGKVKSQMAHDVLSHEGEESL